MFGMESRNRPAGGPASVASSRDERPLPPIPTSSETSEDVREADSVERHTRPGSEAHIDAGSMGEGSHGIEPRHKSPGVEPIPTGSPDSSIDMATFLSEASGQSARPITKNGQIPGGTLQPSTSYASSSTGRDFQPSPVNGLSQEGAQVNEPTALIGNTENPPWTHQGNDLSGSDLTPETLSRTASQVHRRLQRERGMQSTEQNQFIVPRWQPDAEVTLCPICRTQFSFFVRKHHCRKCGRVVCGSCSPHRITIPYQYIVQPPREDTSPTTHSRPTLDSGRIGSSTAVENLGGGERVRLCNPCVPDPNIAPPQVAQSEDNPGRPSQPGHSRSVSTTAASTTARSRTAAESSAIPTAFFTHRRPRQSSILNSYNQSTSSYTDTSNRITRTDELHSRSRRSTVGTNRDTSNMGNSVSYVRQPDTLAREEQHQSSSSRPASSQPRRRLPEEDECWVCHQEVPSRSLNGWEDLREEHVKKCIQDAERGTSPSPAPITIPSNPHRPPVPVQAESSRVSSQTLPPAPTLIPNTPEARMAARERAHAAVVLAAQSPSAAPIRRTGVFPYKATEKDCIDDAECTICLEEFEVGAEMGRLECFCRFHLKCIREWFVVHPGCPVHQHGAGY